VRSRIILIVLSGTAVLLGGFALWVMVPPASPPKAAPVVATPAPAPASPAPKPRPTPPERPAPATPAPVTPPPPRVDTAPATGTLHITSDVPGTSVFIDRKYLGDAPVTATGLEPGTHKLNMAAAGYDGVSEEIEVEVGTHDLSRSFKAIRLDARVDVVHSHAFGSCSGTLSATPQGIRYDTTNTNDAFTAALTDLETFEIDGATKYLKLKIRKGKSYEFRAGAGDATALFTFQRDVEKARQKLLAGGGKEARW
jgi:hypothetical protein